MAADGGPKMNDESTSSADFPVLNHIDIFPVEHEGERLICLRNPRIAEIPPILISELTLHILQYFDGTHSLEDIKEIFTSDYNVDLKRGNLEELVEKLDSSLLLESEYYREYWKNIEENFKKSSILDSSHAGLCYPADASELKRTIDNYYMKTRDVHPFHSFNNVKGIISPHIDYSRGWRSYVKAYSCLENCSARKFIILGTSHYANTQNPYIVTRKCFNTPFGTVNTDTEIIDYLENGSEQDIFDNEIAFRTEHSIEFQVIFLQHILKDRKDITIIPVLCNSFDNFIRKGISPREDPGVSGFLKTLREIDDDMGDDICYIAGVDMAHFGRKFGDEQELDREKLEWIEERDRISLSRISALDPEGFYRSVEQEKDERKICGLSSIYTLLSVTRADRAEILDYDKALEQNSDSVVTFASAAILNRDIQR